jgi:hypothetical protein
VNETGRKGPTRSDPHVRPGITWKTWLAGVIFVSAVFVAISLPLYYGGCRPGWYQWEWHEASGPPPHFFCGRPPPEDDWGYFPHNLLPLKVAVGVGGALLARAVVMAGRRRHGVAGVEAAVALVVIGLVAFVFLYPSKEEKTGQVASTLRCLDPGCGGMTVEQAVMSERSFDPRYPQAMHAWREIWDGLYARHISTDAVRDGLVEEYGERILLDAPSPESG